MPFYPLHLEPFLLLLLAPGLGFIAWKSLAAGPGPRKWVAFGLRSVVLLLLVLALADLRIAERSDKLSVIFLLDHSASVPTEERDRSLLRVAEFLRTMPPDDTAGLVVFGRNASIERVPDLHPEFRRISSVVAAEYTDIGGAIRLAAAAFPQGTQRRLVLLSDGNENRGNALEEARNARASGVSIDVWPVSFRYEHEVQVDRVVVPARVKKNETFEVRIIITATTPTDARVYLSLNRALAEAPRPIRLAKGKNVLVHSLSLDTAGFYTFLARVEAVEDTIAGNNAGWGFTIVEGEPRVLCLGDTLDDAKYVHEALRSQGIPSEIATPASVPITTANLQSFDCLVVANVPAASFSDKQMNAFRSAVVNFGVGLVWIGGDRSYGAGGYFRTPVEDALPVSCEVKQKKILPNGALVLIMHTCEFARGNYWSKVIAKKAISKLSPQDLVGLVYFDWRGGGSQWLFKLTPVADKENLYDKIDTLNPGDMPDFDSAMRLAHRALKGARAAKKHMVIISDGDPSPPMEMLVRGIVRSTIAVSTVLINPHPGDGNAPRIMSSLAARTQGRFYRAATGRQLPGIITRVARKVSTNFIKEQPFTPVQTSASEILKGFQNTGFPELTGRVVTSAKPSAEIALRSPDGDPVLAHWRPGLGRAVAFMSDAKNRWARNWVPWDKFSQFWAQAVRWSMRTVSQNNFNLQARVRGGKGEVILDALDGEGKFVNYLGIKAKVVTPSFKEIPVAVSQKGPGRYGGTFEADEVGAYFVSLTYDGKDVEPGFMSSGTSLSYSPEYRDLSANRPLLNSLVEETGGRLLGPADDVFLHNLPTRLGTEPRWPLLLLLAMAVFFFDVFVRRVAIPYARIAAGALAFARRAVGFWRKPAAAGESSQALSALLRVKSEVAQEHDEAQSRFRDDAAKEEGGDVSLGEPGEAPGAAPSEAPKKKQVPAEESLFTKRLLDAKKKAFDRRKKGREP
jgi:uncharacterized membrane protein